MKYDILMPLRHYHSLRLLSRKFDVQYWAVEENYISLHLLKLYGKHGCLKTLHPVFWSNRTAVTKGVFSDPFCGSSVRFPRSSFGPFMMFTFATVNRLVTRYLVMFNALNIITIHSSVSHSHGISNMLQVSWNPWKHKRSVFKMFLL